MRFLLKLAIKFATMVAMVLLMGAAMRHAPSLLMRVSGGAGGAAPQFSSEESDLMTTVFKSALKLFSGTAKRDALASELSDKLHGGRADAGTMSELGIELVKPGTDTDSPIPGAAGLPGSGKPRAGSSTAEGKAGMARAEPDATSSAKKGGLSHGSPEELLAGSIRTDLLGRIWQQSKRYSMELGMVPVVCLGMLLVQRIRGRRSSGEDLMPGLLGLTLQTPAESEHYDMKHDVHSLGGEEFELLVALIYQRQGYRVSMPAGLSGGRGGDFTLLRKSEKWLVQCKKLPLAHRLPVERVRELHEAMTAAGMKRGLYVVSCGFTWDARNFAKSRGVTLINARTLDELLTAAREKPEEDLLVVSEWLPKLMSKVQVTPPHCPACDAPMNHLNASSGSAWVCSQRPECRGRRNARKHQKTAPAPARETEKQADGVNA